MRELQNIQRKKKKPKWKQEGGWKESSIDEDDSTKQDDSIAGFPFSHYDSSFFFPNQPGLPCNI